MLRIIGRGGSALVCYGYSFPHIRPQNYVTRVYHNSYSDDLFKYV